MKNLTVVVLAGGEGSRFAPMIQDKLLFPFSGAPYIVNTVLQNIPHEATKVVFVTNKRNHAYFSQLKLQIPHVCVQQEVPHGMADAICTAREYIDGNSMLLLIADDLYDGTLPQQIIEKAKNSQVFGVIPGYKPSSYFPGGYLELKNGKIVGIIEKPGEGNEPSPYVNIACHYLENSTLLFEAIEQTDSAGDDVYERALSKLIGVQSFEMVEYTGKFSSLKYSWHILSVMDQLLDKISPFQGENVEIKPHVVIEGPVHIGNNVKIMEFTKIVGPCWIGDNTIIGNNNVIRHSMIGDGCITGFSSDITRSYIGNSCWFHTNYIGDSVLEENISMGSGTVLANLRLDESIIHSDVKSIKTTTQRNKLGAIIGKNVRIGVNTSLMPGVKVGANSLIGAGITITQDIPQDSYVHGSATIVTQTNTRVVGNDREKFRKNL